VIALALVAGHRGDVTTLVAMSHRSSRCTLFSDDAITLIHQASCGYPRAINNLAIAALLAAFTEGKAIVDENSARTAVTEVTTE
jgi:type II secretory pathway predicted ATPase ExeA